MRGPETDDRVAGYRDALEAAGIAFDPCLVWPGNYRLGERRGGGGEPFPAHGRSPDGGVRGQRRNAPSASSRRCATPACRCREDVSVAGFDDIGYAALFDPGLTTMRQPRAELGRVAAEILVRRMTGNGGPPPPRITRLPCTLIVRESVAPPAPPRRATARGGRRRAVPASRLETP